MDGEGPRLREPIALAAAFMPGGEPMSIDFDPKVGMKPLLCVEVGDRTAEAPPNVGPKRETGCCGIG